MTASSQPAADTATPVNEGVDIAGDGIEPVNKTASVQNVGPKERKAPRLSPLVHALIWIFLGILLAAAIIFAWPLSAILQNGK